MKNVPEEGEFDRTSVIAGSATAAFDGKTYQVEYSTSTRSSRAEQGPRHLPRCPGADLLAYYWQTTELVWRVVEVACSLYDAMDLSRQRPKEWK
jgi:hypothetical protein